jgi:predicted AAA+ superfamily ATPase
MDIFRRGGDSLQGRYHHHRLHPFSLHELLGRPISPLPVPGEFPTVEFGDGNQELTDLLFKFGGFPEPLFSANERVLRRWHRERFERVLREDIRETETVRALSQVELLGAMLPERVAAPLSLRSLSVDLEASPKSVAVWMDLLARNYYVFRVPPWHRRLARALKKECKYYLWDWSEVRDEGARFENMVAGHLLKWCHYQQDVEGHDVDLHYVRDLEKREVDFLIVWEKTPWLLVECKLGGNYRFGHLNYFADKLGIKTRRYMVTLTGGDDYVDKASGVRVIPAARFLGAFV